MRGIAWLGLAALSAVLSPALSAGPQGPCGRVKEIFVPRTSEFTQQHPGAVNSFDLSPDGKTLAVEFDTQEPDRTIGAWVALWDVDKHRFIAAKQVDRDIPHIVWYTRGIRFSPDGRKLLVLTGPHLVALSYPTLKVLYAFEDRVLPENAEERMFIEGFSMASNRLAILKQYDHNSDHSFSLEVKIADLDSGRVFAHWSRPGLSRSIALSPDAKLLALTINPVFRGMRTIPSGEKNIFIFRAESGEIARAFSSGYAAGDAEFLPGGAELATIPADHQAEVQLYPRDAVTIWNLATAQVERELGYPKYGVRGEMAISASGECLAVVDVWHNPSDIALDRGVTRGWIRLLVWRPSTGTLVYCSEELDQEYMLGGLPIQFYSGGTTSLVRLSGSGSRLAVGGKLISVYSLETAAARAGR